MNLYHAFLMTYNEIIQWLLKGDVSIQYQVHRDLLHTSRPELLTKIEKSGWGRTYISLRNKDGHWGRGFYQPKWTSTHYTLLDLKDLSISPRCTAATETVQIILASEKGIDGGLNPSGTIKSSDVCINGMALNYCSYFKAKPEQLKSIIDFLLSQHMADGGFNCRSNRSGAHHSSLHTTLSVLEGIHEYAINNYTYRLAELQQAAKEAREFILLHRLFKSDKTGRVIDKKMLALHFPTRWRYDLLRALDYFRIAGIRYDNRMDDAIEEILKKRNKENLWNLAAHYPGAQHFKMEEAGKPSRWNTLRALRVLNHFTGVQGYTHPYDTNLA